MLLLVSFSHVYKMVGLPAAKFNTVDGSQCVCGITLSFSSLRLSINGCSCRVLFFLRLVCYAKYFDKWIKTNPLREIYIISQRSM